MELTGVKGGADFSRLNFILLKKRWTFTPSEDLVLVLKRDV